MMPGLDSDQIRHAILTAQAKGYRQVRVRLGDDRFSAVLSEAPKPEAEPVEDEPEFAVTDSAPESAHKEQTVNSPAVGYFRPSEGVKVGGKVAEGDKVGEVVALGLANDVTAKTAGEIAEVLVSDGDAVEYGQKILVLRS